MKHFIVWILLCLSLGLAGAQSSSQPTTPPVAPSYSLRTITVRGSKQFAEGDIIKATGLKVGTKVSRNDLNQASSRLADSGVFTQVSYTFDGRTAEYVVVDSQQLVSASFENFIWFSDSELVSRVHDSVPLFAGGVPQSGNLADQISTALEVLLKEKNISGRVVATPFPDSGPASAMQFRIEGVDVRIAAINFPGATPPYLPILQGVEKEARVTSYLRSSTPSWVKKRVQALYGTLGFLKVQVDSPKVTIEKDDVSEPTIILNFPVQEGPQFMFAGAVWSGNAAVPTADLARLVTLKTGLPADTTQVVQAAEAATDIYATKGYMHAQVKSTATLDSEERTAAFQLVVDEGPLYHMGKLEVQNLDAQQAELVRKVWDMKEGDVYNSSYPKTFLKDHPQQLSSLNGWQAIFTQTIHDDAQVVDLSVNFQKMQPAGK